MILSWPALFSNRIVSVPPCVYVCPSCVSFHRLFWLAVHILSAGCVWVFSLCLLLLFELQTEMPPVNFLSHPPFFLLFLFLALSLLFCFALLVAPKLDVSQCDKTIKDKRIWVWFKNAEKKLILNKNMDFKCEDLLETWLYEAHLLSVSVPAFHIPSYDWKTGCTVRPRKKRLRIVINHFRPRFTYSAFAVILPFAR